MLGILCEKPSQAKNFANALGGMSGIYDGVSYVIASSVGHIFSFDKDLSKQVGSEKASKYTSWSLNNLPWNEKDFMWKRSIVDPKKKEVFERIRSTFANCDEIAIATDNDPTKEGQLLAWEILDAAGFKPRKWLRFYFDDETPHSIRKAFENRKQIPPMLQDPEYHMAYFRTRWDFLSMQFTRAATCITGKQIRQGRLKSAMVVMTGEGIDAVNKYKKVPFYQWRFIDENDIVYTDPNEQKHPTKDEMTPKFNRSKVVIDSTEKMHMAPPKFMDLATLAARLSVKNIKPEITLKTYQKMYEASVVSYPRTQDRYITIEQFHEMLPLASKIAAVVGVDDKYLTHCIPRRTHVKSGMTHGANRPGINVPSTLAELKQYGEGAEEIYTLLAKNFLQMFGEDYVYIHQKGHLDNYPTFEGYANAPVSMGFKSIYSDPADEEDEEDKPTKLLGKEAAPFIYEGFPPKPPTPTMKWLMKQLEKRDVGTGATRTSIFADISRDYSKDALIKETKGRLALTDIGRMSYLILPGTHIGSLNLTEQVYGEMQAVLEGKGDEDKFLHQIQQMVIDDIAVMKRNLPNVKREFPEAGKVELRPQKEYVTGTFIPTGQTVTFNKVWNGHKFTEKESNDLLSGFYIYFDMTGQNGDIYKVEGNLQQQTYKGKTFWGFRRREPDCPPDKVEGIYLPKNTKIRFKCNWSGYSFTGDEIAALLNGDDITITYIGHDAKEHTVTGRLKQQTYNGNKFWGFSPDFIKKEKGTSKKTGNNRNSQNNKGEADFSWLTNLLG